MINQQGVETRGRYDGHTEEDEQTERKGSKFVLQPRVVVTKYQKDDQHRGQADSDRQARPEQHAGNYCQWSHVVFSEVDYYLPQ